MPGGMEGEEQEGETNGLVRAYGAHGVMGGTMKNMNHLNMNGLDGEIRVGLGPAPS